MNVIGGSDHRCRLKELTQQSHHSPDELAANYGLGADMKSSQMIAGALSNLTSAATAP